MDPEKKKTVAMFARYGTNLWFLLAHFIYAVGGKSEAVAFAVGVAGVLKLVGIYYTITGNRLQDLFTREVAVRLIGGYVAPVLVLQNPTIKIAVEILSISPLLVTVVMFITQIHLPLYLIACECDSI